MPSEDAIFSDSSSSLALPLSSNSSSASLSGCESSTSTVVQNDDLANLEKDKPELLPSTPPRAKPTDSSMIAQAKILAKELTTTGLDPTVLLLSKLLDKQMVTSQPMYDLSGSLVKSIGPIEQGDNIFVFLNRFEYGMKSNGVRPCDWINILPKLLHGEFKEAYFNCITNTTSYHRMRTILLNTGGYSLNNCLSSFPVKFRQSGSQSVMQFFNNWKYRYSVMLSQLSFLDVFTEDQLDLICQGVAALGIVAGMPIDACKSVLDRHHNSPQAFVEDCASSLCSADSAYRPYHPGSYNSHSPPRYSNHSQSHRNSVFHHGSNRHHSNNSQRPHSNYSTPFSNYQYQPRPQYQSQHQTPTTPPTPVPRRDISEVQCHKCGAFGHYANRCPDSSYHQSSHQPSQPQPITSPQPNPPPNTPRPAPSPRSQPPGNHQPNSQTSNPTSAYSVEKFESLVHSPLPAHTNPDSEPLNKFDDDFITHGHVNGVFTPVIVDSGAKRSLVSSDFITSNLSPVSSESLCGISRITSTLPVYDLEIDIPTISGVARFAACPTLPPKTVLLGIDFGRDKFVQLINSIKQNPSPVNTVTRAMQADDQLSEHISEALHASEGCTPVSFDDISESVTIHDSSASDVLAGEHSSNPDSTGFQNKLIPVSLPSLSFDGVNMDKFIELQHRDPSLLPLWDLAHKHEKKFFIVDGLLMCLTTTHNTVSSALVVPIDLRHKILVVAHDGLGHGGVNVTRTLINRHFTWPKLLDDIRSYISACPMCQKFTKSNNIKVPLVESEIISERGEKLAIDIVGPLPKSKGSVRFIFTCLELAAGYPFAIPIKNYTAETTAQCLISIISVLGVPLEILSEPGANFLSTTVSHLCKKFGIHKIRTSPYRPQSNGRLERFHGTLKSMLSKSIAEKSEWSSMIDLILYYARNMPNTRLGFTPHKLLFLKPTPFIHSTIKSLWLSDSQNPVNVPQFIADLDKQFACHNHVVKTSLQSKQSSDRISKESELVSKYLVGDLVFKRNPGLNSCLDSSWDGPFIITSLLPPVNCEIAPHKAKGRKKVVHLSQLKRVSDNTVLRVAVVANDLSPHFDLSPRTPTKIDLSPHQQSVLDNTLSAFPNVFTDIPGITSLVKHSIILTSQTPVWTPAYTVPLAYQQPFREEIESLLNLGIIEPSNSKWCSSPLPVKKHDGGIRIVVDYRKLNLITVPEPFLMPSIDSILAQIGNCKFLSKLDLLKGFHQVPLEDSTKHLTAFSCMQGKFQYRVMLFGLRNAPATFQLLMQQVLRGLESYSLAYIDDVIIFSATFDDHITHIFSVLGRLSAANLSVKQSKCCWLYSSFEFLGFVVGDGKLSISEAKVQHIKNYLPPKTKTDLRAFLGLVTFYSRFIPSFANHTSVLSSHLRRDSPDILHYDTDSDFYHSFQCIISEIVHHSSLFLPSITDVWCVYTDASTKGIGGCLCIYREDNWVPVSFYSRQLSAREKNYPIVELEALAVLATIEHFRFYLSGRPFKIFTDHSALVDIWNGPPPSAKLARWIERLSDFDFTITYIKGETNTVADALSRQSWTAPAANVAADVTSSPLDGRSASWREGDVVYQHHIL